MTNREAWSPRRRNAELTLREARRRALVLELTMSRRVGSSTHVIERQSTPQLRSGAPVSFRAMAHSRSCTARA